MKNMLQRRTIKIALALLVFVVTYMINFRLKFLVIPRDESSMREYLFNIITVCTVFAGFSFTVLGLLISLAPSKTMDRLKETSFLANNCNVIADSIVMFVISTFVSLFIVFVIYSEFILKLCERITLFKLHDIIVNLLYIISIGYLIYGIILFSFSVKKVIVIMQQIFEEDITKGKMKAKKFSEAAQKQRRNMEKFESDDFEKNVFKSD